MPRSWPLSFLSQSLLQTQPQCTTGTWVGMPSDAVVESQKFVLQAVFVITWDERVGGTVVIVEVTRARAMACELGDWVA